MLYHISMLYHIKIDKDFNLFSLNEITMMMLFLYTCLVSEFKEHTWIKKVYSVEYEIQ